MDKVSKLFGLQFQIVLHLRLERKDVTLDVVNSGRNILEIGEDSINHSDVIVVHWNGVLLEDSNHCFNTVDNVYDVVVVDEFYLRDCLHDRHKQFVVFLVIDWIFFNTVFNGLIEALDVCDDEFDLLVQETSVDLHPGLDLDSKAFFERLNVDSQPADVVNGLLACNFHLLVFKLVLCNLD